MGGYRYGAEGRSGSVSRDLESSVDDVDHGILRSIGI